MKDRRPQRCSEVEKVIFKAAKYSCRFAYKEEKCVVVLMEVLEAKNEKEK